MSFYPHQCRDGYREELTLDIPRCPSDKNKKVIPSPEPTRIPRDTFASLSDIITTLSQRSTKEYVRLTSHIQLPTSFFHLFNPTEFVPYSIKLHN